MPLGVQCGAKNTGNVFECIASHTSARWKTSYTLYLRISFTPLERSEAECLSLSFSHHASAPCRVLIFLYA